MTFVSVKDYDASKAMAQGEIGRFNRIWLPFAPVSEACQLCDRAVKIYELSVRIRETFEFSDREKFEAWVRVGRWIKTGRLMP